MIEHDVFTIPDPLAWRDGPSLCSFGVTEAIAGVIGGLAASAGVGAAAAATIGTVGTGVLLGAGTGALESAVTGGKPLLGALTGGVTGGAIGGLGPVVGDALGVSAPMADALVGGVTNAGLSAATGQSPVTGGLMGALGGYAAGSLGGMGGTSSGGDNIDVFGDPIGGGAGGAVDAAGNPIGAGSTDTSNWGSGGSGQGSGAFGSNPAPPSADNWNAPVTNTSARIASGNGGGGGSGGLFGGKISDTSLLLGALSAAGSLFSKPQQTTVPTPSTSSPSAAQNLGALYNTPLNTSVAGRTAISPPGLSPVLPQSPTVASVNAAPSYYRYGSMPEQTFFTNNSTGGFGFARGGALQATKDREFSTASGEHFVRGEGDGTSDSVPAKLSDGEYVLDAGTVSRLGMGSNEAGAKKLDQFREWLAKQSGQKKFIPAKTKGALSNLAGRAA